MLRASHLIIVLLLSAFGAVATAADARVEAVHVTTATAGHTLGEDLWARAPAVSDFVQREPREGAEPSQATEFRVAYDATILYVKVRRSEEGRVGKEGRSR